MYKLFEDTFIHILCRTEQMSIPYNKDRGFLLRTLPGLHERTHLWDIQGLSLLGAPPATLEVKLP